MKTNINFFLRPTNKNSPDKSESQAKSRPAANRSVKETPILCFLSVSGKYLDQQADRYKTRTVRYKFNTGIKIRFSEWDVKRQQPKDSRPDKQEIINKLQAFGKRAEEVFNEVYTGGVLPEFEELKQAIFAPDLLPDTTQTPVNLVTPADEFNRVERDFKEQVAASRNPRTLQRFNSLFTVLREYERRNRTPLTFEAINLRFVEKFTVFLTTRKGRGKREQGRDGIPGMLNDTISKYLSSLRTFLQWGYEREYHTNRTWERISAPRSKKVDIVTLTESELMDFYRFDFSQDKRLERVRDLFCFGAFTGQRWSDTAAFNRRDIVQKLHYTAWEFEPIKTPGKKILIPFTGFCKPAWDILQKYEFVLPDISATNFNLYIKEAATVAGLNNEVVIKRKSGAREIVTKKTKREYISSHMARRTFVTILLERGMRPLDIMKFTGHMDIKTLMKYENTSHESAIAALERISGAFAGSERESVRIAQ